MDQGFGAGPPAARLTPQEFAPQPHSIALPLHHAWLRLERSHTIGRHWLHSSRFQRSKQSKHPQSQRSAVTLQRTGTGSLLKHYSPLCRQLRALVFTLLVCKGVGKQTPHKSQGRKPSKPHQSITIIKPNNLLSLKRLLFTLTTCSGTNATYHSLADNHRHINHNVYFKGKSFS